MNKALIVAGGVCVSQKILFLYRDRFIVAADKGACYLKKYNIIPDLFIGDLDSVDTETLQFINVHHIDKKIFDSKKDYTDTDLCVQELLERGFDDIVICCATGKRFDHQLATIAILIRLEKLGKTAKIVDDNNELYVLSKGLHNVSKNNKKYFSLLSITACSEYTTSGFLYEVKHCRITRENAGLGISNELKNEYGALQIHTGIVLIVQSND